METTVHSESRDIKISVVMPIYNAEKYLGRAIRDVLNQTLSDIELICVDDGSTDNSTDIINSFVKKDSRVSSIRQSNAGPSVARNKGFVLAQGKYVIFLDADDMYEPTLLESLYNMAQKDNLDVAVTRFDIYNESSKSYVKQADEPHASIFAPGKVTSKNEYPDFIFASTTGYVWNKLFKAPFLKAKALVFDPELYVFEDVCFVASALALAERVGRIEGNLIHHRVYSDQSRARLFRKYYGHVPFVYKKLKKFLMARGMYIPLKKGFLNLSAGRCFKIYNLLWAEGKEELWNMLHDEYVHELEWLTHDKSAFESAEVCEFVANVALYTHAEYLERTDKGMSIVVDELEENEISDKVQKNQKISKRRDGWHKFTDFINIFKKKK